MGLYEKLLNRRQNGEDLPWKPVDSATLKTLYLDERKSNDEIAGLFNTTPGSVEYYLRQFGINGSLLEPHIAEVKGFVVGHMVKINRLPTPEEFVYICSEIEAEVHSYGTFGRIDESVFERLPHCAWLVQPRKRMHYWDEDSPTHFEMLLERKRVGVVLDFESVTKKDISLLWHCRTTDQQVAELYGVSRSSVTKKRQEFGIKRDCEYTNYRAMIDLLDQYLQDNFKVRLYYFNEDSIRNAMLGFIRENGPLESIEECFAITYINNIITYLEQRPSERRYR